MAAPVPIDSPLRSAPPSSPVPERRTLLIVDDEEGPRESLRIVFSRDYEVLEAEEGIRAVELVKAQRVDAVILDLCMPGLTGIEVLQRIKEIEPGIEVVILTAYETIETARQAIHLGACDYLTKPFDLGTITAAVARAISRRTLFKKLAGDSRRLQELQGTIEHHKMQTEIAQVRGEIYAGAVHDLNGPLTIISGFIEMANAEIHEAAVLEGKDLDLVREHLAEVSRQVSQCIDISQRYLGFLRKRSVNEPDVGVNRILADLAELLKVHPNARNNRLDVQSLAEEERVTLNNTCLIQILLNLTINAFQCTSQPHQVSIQARRVAEPLDFSRINDGPEDRIINRDRFQNVAPLLAIAVQDNGPGIDPEVLARLFEPGYTTKPKGHGTGFGLVIVRRFIQRAKGAIHLHTKLGQGTTFTLYLPVRQPAPGP